MRIHTRTPIALHLGLLTLVLSFGIGSSAQQTLANAAETPLSTVLEPTVEDELPAVQREFRGAWVATVANIDWPSSPNLSTHQQKVEAIAILDKAKSIGLNAIVLQVRPQGDALFQSKLEPWSYYLTGQQGREPSPYYDPLRFWIEESHARGLELHAWLNPYRVRHTVMEGENAPTSIINRRPDLVHHLPSGFVWMDPGFEDTAAHSREVMLDVLRRYDVDGIHMDDYFYPYDSYNNGEDFPDDVAWKQYLAGGGKLERNDWRRDNVNRFVHTLHTQIKEIKPHVKFGISPFGIWRPGVPQGTTGYDQYDKLFADAKLWLNEGWIDYYAPQLYWPISQIKQSFPVLLSWWHEQNHKNKFVWPGLYTSRMTNTWGPIYTPEEVTNQIMTAHGADLQRGGHIHFSMKTLMENPEELNETLAATAYSVPALVPQTPNESLPPVVAPSLEVVEEGKMPDTYILNWGHERQGDVRNWVLYYQGVTDTGFLYWKHEILGAREVTRQLTLQVGDGTKPLKIALAAVDSHNTLGSATIHTIAVPSAAPSDEPTDKK